MTHIPRILSNKRKIITRSSGPNEDTWQFIRDEYTSDKDVDDLAKLFQKNYSKKLKYPLPLDYRLINQLLLIKYFNLETTDKTYIEFTERINEIEGELNEIESELNEDSNISIQIIIAELIKNIIYLYSFFDTLPTLNRYDSNMGSLTLWSGLESFQNNLFGEHLKNTTIGQTIELPCFISTSITKDTAMRFITIYNPIIIKVIVKKEKFSEFKYLPLFDKTIQLPLNKLNNIQEYEVLLSPYSIYKITSVEYDKIIPFYKPILNNSPKKFMLKATLYTLEFVKLGSKSPSKLADELSRLKLLDPIEDEMTRPSKKPRKAGGMVTRKNNIYNNIYTNIYMTRASKKPRKAGGMFTRKNKLTTPQRADRFYEDKTWNTILTEINKYIKNGGTLCEGWDIKSVDTVLAKHVDIARNPDEIDRVKIWTQKMLENKHYNRPANELKRVLIRLQTQRFL